MLIDSNIIIYAMQPDQDDIRKLIEKNAPFVSSSVIIFPAHSSQTTG